jgi:DNA-binding response OmpR family regulator
MIVLLVEDEIKIADFVKTALEHEQYSVETVADGEVAIKKIGINDYDLIILDLMLPGKDGFEVCREVRRLELKVPVLMLTARDLPEDKVKGLDMGADDYLTKPFELSELLARVRALLRREKEIKPQILRAGDLTLDTLSKEVRRNNRLIELTRKEYRLLEYLMRRAGSVCSRTMLKEHIWGFKELNSNAIEVHIKRLRQKIEGKSGKKLLYTLYGTGYKIRG